MQSLKIFVSGSTDNLRLERETLARAWRSLRIDAARIDAKFSDERSPRAENLELVYECDIFIGLYNRTHYGWTDPATGVSLTEQEFDQAQRLEKPKLIFVKPLHDADRPNPQQLAFVERILNMDDKNTHALEFADPAQLEDQAAEALMALIAERFALRVARPIFQAPSALETFVGREPQLDKLFGALALGRTVLIHGVGDVGGMGKSELAVYAAHHLRDRFPDGVLWANAQTARPADTLTAWARAYGGFPALGRDDLRFEHRALSTEQRRLEEIAARADETRRVLRGKRVLAILDGVISEDDDAKLAPLLQALSDNAVIVTSRTRRLRSLKATTLIDLERMNETEAWSLFARVVGAERLENERARIAEIARLVDLLPLGLDLAATLLRERQSMTPRSLFELLRSEREPLESTRWGYPNMRGTRAALNTTRMFLSEDDSKFFAALGVFAGEDFDAQAAASVAETTLHVAERTLKQLTRFSFVQSKARPGRYRLHSVLRSYARDQLTDWNAELRMAKYYTGLAKEYGRKLQGPETHSAHAILTTELSNIFAAQRYARERNDRPAWELRRDLIYGAMTYYFNLHAMWSDWISWSHAGIAACQKLEDERGAVAIAGSLGMVYQQKGDWDQAIEFYQHALALLEKLMNLQGVATIYMNLGIVEMQKGEWAKAITALSRSLQFYERVGDRHGLGQARANLGVLYANHGERNKARAYWMQALELFDSLGAQNEGDVVRKWLKNLPRENRE